MRPLAPPLASISWSKAAGGGDGQVLEGVLSNVEGDFLEILWSAADGVNFEDLLT